jgi:lipopolysaccharide/colanic/teichoic acid biosynthesis glycosyltransferase
MRLIRVKANSSQTEPFAWIERYHQSKPWLSQPVYLFMKRLLDIVCCILVMPLFITIFLLCALLIKVESPDGPILFTQMRTGRNGRRFRMYKFRTMVPNAEELKRQLVHLNELQWPDFKITNDPRILWIGKIMRKTSLDEIPQLFNILKGEMTIVGPRPTSFDANTYKLWQTERLDVTPGITGLWQIYGRAKTEFDDRLRLDILYIQNQRMMVDLEIMLRTVAAVVTARGAH